MRRARCLLRRDPPFAEQPDAAIVNRPHAGARRARMKQLMLARGQADIELPVSLDF